ncbi:MAG TPA: ATP-binding cassette domain-containing protein [Flavobacteriales bacterium]|nr:ATP-binding cassette domain-containing protein [Flavobacteriales bacterium]
MAVNPGFNFSNVVPDAMADVPFPPDSLWKNDRSFTKEHTIVLAPSGSGKTSLMAFMYGMRHDFTGTISYDGKNITQQSLKWWSHMRQKSLGAIFQDLRLVPHLTVGQNLILKNNLTNHKSIDEIKAMLAHLGMIEKWNQTCGTLSYGQQQRVCIVRALLQPLDFLLADEPFSHIDDANIEKARQLILEECERQNAAFIMFSLGYDYGIRFNYRYNL